MSNDDARVGRSPEPNCASNIHPSRVGQSNEREQKGKMNLTIWTGIREYVAAEIQLAFARQNFDAASVLGSDEDMKRIAGKISKLEEQSTRMETSVREAL